MSFIKIWREVAAITLGIGAANIIDQEVYSMVVGQGPSMIPTFGNNNVLLVSRIQWKLGLVKKGDIVFSKTPFDKDTSVVKRIIHFPGETVVLKNGEKVKLEPNHYWLLGDNQERSFDSRHYGPIPGHMIQGLITGMIYPKIVIF